MPQLARKEPVTEFLQGATFCKKQLSAKQKKAKRSIKLQCVGLVENSQYMMLTILFIALQFVWTKPS